MFNYWELQKTHHVMLNLFQNPLVLRGLRIKSAMTGMLIT